MFAWTSTATTTNNSNKLFNSFVNLEVFPIHCENLKEGNSKNIQPEGMEIQLQVQSGIASLPFYKHEKGITFSKPH